MEVTNVMSDFTTNAGSLLTWVLTSIGSIASTVMETPVLAVGFYILLISFAVGLFIRIAGSR